MSVAYNPTPIRGQASPLFLDQNGNGTGNTNAVGDYSIVSATFFRQIAPPFKFAVNFLSVLIMDNAAISTTGYGSQSTPLTNGLTLQFQTGGVLFTSSVSPIQTNAKLIGASTRSDIYSFSGNDRGLQVYFNFVELNGQPLILHGINNDFLRVIANDDFTFLNFHNFVITGILFR